MQLPPFKIESFQSLHKKSIDYNLSAADAETLSLSELIDLADNEVKELWNKCKLSYSSTEGHHLLRHEIANLYGKMLNDKQIITFAGAQEAIYATINTLIEKNDKVLVVAPTYQSLVELPIKIGAQVDIVNLEWRNNQFILDENILLSLITNDTKLIILNFPNNPTGYIPSKNFLYKIIEKARKYNAYVLNDEVYQTPDKDPNSLPPVADLYDQGLSIGVLSKSLGLSGVRVGWLACQNQMVLDKILKRKHYLSICNGVVCELLAIIGLRNKKQILKKNKNIIERNLKLLNDLFSNRQEIISWYQPKTGYLSFPKININWTAEDFSNKLLQEEKILLLPSNLFDYGNKHLRFGFGKENLDVALEKLDSFLTKYF